MIIEFFKKSKFLFILSLFIILISIINSLFYVSYNNYPQEINSTNFLLQNSESVHSSGTGPSIQVLEYANGSKNHYDLNNGTSISWDIPNNWIGDNFSVMVSNLTTSVKNDLYEVADDGNTNILNHISGNYADTRFDDNNNWSLRWGDIETTLITLDANLYFYTLAYQGTISNLHVHLKLTTTNCNKNNYLEIRLMDESSGYYVIDHITSSGTFIIDQDISSSPDSYVDPNNRLWINFYGSNQGPGSIKRVDIDYVYINITTSRMYIDPDIIHMNVNGTAITGTWDLAVAGLYGPWSSGTCWFTFDCDPGYSISFNAFSTMWINKTSHTGSTYYLGSGDHPSVNYWKITFNAIDASVDYQDQEFIILHPAKWVFNNATGPSGTVPVSPGSYKGNSTIPITQTYYESGLWEFFCSSQNIISNIYIRKNGHDVDTVNITDIVDISCTLIESNTQGSFNLSIYNESGIVHQELQTASGNTVIFTSWNLSQDIINNGVYTIEISWKNETDIGYIRDYITIIYPTELINYTIHHTYFIGNILEMTVFYNNTFAKNGFIENGIIGANLDYVIKNSSNPSIDSGILNDTNNGNYTNSINLSSYSIGNYTLIINASKKWYHNLSISFYIEIFGFNTSINISLPMSNGIGQAYCNYTETVVFKLWYFNVTQNNSSFINGANIEVYKSSIPVSTVFWEESVAESVYYIYLNSSNLDLVSTWDDINNNITITVQVSKHSFIPRTINIEWDVRNSTAILFGNSSETRLSGRFGIKLNYTNQQLNNPISDYFSPSFRLYYNGTLFSSLKSNYLSIGLWNLSCFFNETRNVTYNILVKVSTVGFKDTTWNFLLHVNVTATKNYTFGITENIFYYQDLNFSIIYNKTYPVLDGLDNAEIISTKFAITTTNMGSGLYFVNVHTANLLNVSHYKIYFLIRQTHFQEINFSISFNIINVTTKSVIFNTTDTSFDGNNTRAYVNQSIIYELIYNDTFKNSFIKDSTIIARIYNYNNDLISSQYTFQSYPAFYRIKVDIFGIHSGNYTLKIISRKQNYFESVITLNFTIMPSITQMVLLRNHPQYGIIQFTEYTEWDHYQIFFMSNFTGIFYNEFKQYKQPISWGYVRYIICEKDKTPNNQSNWLKNGTFVYSIQNELYCSPSISLKYSNGTFLPTGNYTVYVYTFARDCINRSMNFSLTIVPRLTGKIEVFTVSSITQGQSFQIQVKLTVNDNPYSAQLKMYIYCYDSDGNLILNKSYTMITGLNGIDIKLFQAPNDASKISIDVKFSGEFRPYPLVSIEPISLAQPITISVQKSVNFLPIILLIIAICAAFIGTIVYVRSKVIAPKKTKKLEISQEKYTHFKDLTSIMNIMLVYKPTNEITYNKILIDKGYDEEYWNNLKNKILEFKGSGNKKNAALDLIFYDSIKILIDDGQYIRLALLLENIPSEIILRSVVDFIQYFELNHYGYLKKNELNKINDLEEYLDKQKQLSIWQGWYLQMKAIFIFQIFIRKYLMNP
ncbi:MAG: hypothetical protein ACTSRP_10935 [Candidatus Helarchaeota archaeon]